MGTGIDVTEFYQEGKHLCPIYTKPENPYYHYWIASEVLAIELFYPGYFKKMGQKDVWRFHKMPVVNAGMMRRFFAHRMSMHYGIYQKNGQEHSFVKSASFFEDVNGLDAFLHPMTLRLDALECVKRLFSMSKTHRILEDIKDLIPDRDGVICRNNPLLRPIVDSIYELRHKMITGAPMFEKIMLSDMAPDEKFIALHSNDKYFDGRGTTFKVPLRHNVDARYFAMEWE